MTSIRQSAAFASSGVAQKRAKDLYDRAVRLFRREPGWATATSALHLAMTALTLTAARGASDVGSLDDREASVRALDAAKQAVEALETKFIVQRVGNRLLCDHTGDVEFAPGPEPFPLPSLPGPSLRPR